MKNADAKIDRVPMKTCIERAAALGRSTAPRLLAPSSFADAIWPGHRMRRQGAGAAATRILKVMEKQGRAGWRLRSHEDHGWWAR